MAPAPSVPGWWGTSPSGAQKARHDGHASVGNWGVPGGNYCKNGLKAFGLSEEELLVTPYSHPSKLIIALAVRQSTLVPYAWISNRLHMGIPKSMGTLLHRAKKMAETDLKTRAWIERLSS